MRVLILNGSFRKNGNTETLAGHFASELIKNGVSVKTLTLRDMRIASCDACWVCQDFFEGYGCSKKDDMYGIVDEILSSDCFILATPIYSWYCTPPMKAMLDRHYGMNKYYGKEPGPCLWRGKKCGIIATCGYETEYGTGPFEEGIKRLAIHSNLDYVGKLAVRDTDNLASFMAPEAINAAINFAKRVIESCNN